MRRGTKVACSLLLGLLVVGGYEPTWVYLASDGSGVTGQALIGPTCPSVSLAHPCPPAPKPFSGIVTRRGWPAVAVVIHTGDSGRFRERLAPGAYALHVLLNPWRPAYSLRVVESPISFTVRAHAYTRVVVSFDSGIR
jgi:hypothetical protein